MVPRRICNDLIYCLFHFVLLRMKAQLRSREKPEDVPLGSGGQMVGVTLKISRRQMDKQTDSKHIHKKD